MEFNRWSIDVPQRKLTTCLMDQTRSFWSRRTSPRCLCLCQHNAGQSAIRWIDSSSSSKHWRQHYELSPHHWHRGGLGRRWRRGRWRLRLRLHLAGLGGFAMGVAVSAASVAAAWRWRARILNLYIRLRVRMSSPPPYPPPLSPPGRRRRRFRPRLRNKFSY